MEKIGSSLGQVGRSIQLPYSGKLSREKTFTKFGGVASFGITSKQSGKVFSVTILFFHQFSKVFSHESFPLYGTVTISMLV